MSGDTLWKQQKRIDHITQKTGIRPIVLDLQPEAFDLIIEELIAMPVYYTSPSSGISDKDKRRTYQNGFDLFGIRFIKGYVT